MIRALDPSCAWEIDLVARRMRETLIEVLGEKAGGAMYPEEWLRERVRFHLDPNQSTGQVFVALADDGQISGHFIVRIESDDSGRKFGFGSTIFVDPRFRRQGYGNRFLAQGEAWMRERGMTEAHYYTAEGNMKLINLYRKNGWEVVQTIPEKRMVGLRKNLQPRA